MRHEGDGVAKVVGAPFQSASHKARSNVAYAKSALSTHVNGQYLELDDFHAPSDTIPSHGRTTRSFKSSRGKFYFPNTLWTRSFALIGLLETFFTVGIETYVNKPVLFILF